jgi:hypothetical protein
MFVELNIQEISSDGNSAVVGSSTQEGSFTLTRSQDGTWVDETAPSCKIFPLDQTRFLKIYPKEPVNFEVIQRRQICCRLLIKYYGKKKTIKIRNRLLKTNEDNYFTCQLKWQLIKNKQYNKIQKLVHEKVKSDTEHLFYEWHRVYHQCKKIYVDNGFLTYDKVPHIQKYNIGKLLSQQQLKDIVDTFNKPTFGIRVDKSGEYCNNLIAISDQLYDYIVSHYLKNE